ncbi:hypothetical protein ISCGN_030024 [Ixodes scapularis]
MEPPTPLPAITEPTMMEPATPQTTTAKPTTMAATPQPKTTKSTTMGFAAQVFTTLSAADAMIGIISYGVAASLNWSNMEGLFNLVNFLFGKDVLPGSKFLLRKIWSKLKERMTKHHFFCKECGTNVVAGTQDGTPCPNCQAVVPTKNFSQRNFFTTLDLKLQLEVLLADEGHPDMVMCLNPFVNEINRIGTITWESGGHVVNTTVQIVCCCVDAPARVAVLNMKQFNGYYGCTWCLQKGTFLNGSMRYPVQEDGAVAPERTVRSSRKDAAAALQKGEPSRGVKGPSPLMNAPGPDLVWGANPDYLHCVLEGVTKQICEKWLTCTQLECYIGTPKTVEIIDKRLLQLTPPQWFTRLPRSLVDRPFWKASEWKWWLLHYAIPCLEGVARALNG